MKEFFFKVIVGGFFLVFLLRLFQLQILQGKENRYLADNNRLKKISVAAPRGLLVDRHGEILASNKPVYFFEGKEISREEALVLQEKGEESELLIKFQRQYFGGESFGHVLGYLGQVNEKELNEGKLFLQGYDVGDWIGRMGVEKQYEEILRGQKGSRLLEVDTLGRVVREVSQALPIPGKKLTLAIDKGLQEKASQAMGAKIGAVVASKPQTGEILILYSSPSFDPNLFIKSDSSEVLRIISDETKRPLFNRAISGIYPPGSTFKIVTAVAGLEEGKITPQTLIADTGIITVGAYKYTNWYFTQYGKTEGEINLEKAIGRSTDTFFYKLGEMVGAEKLIEWARKFGLDKSFGLDLPGEAAGFIGTPEWKEKVKKESWFLGNTYHLAIGQGDLALTPLGVNLMTAAIANGGKVCVPRILRIGEKNTFYKEECRDLGIKRETLETVKRGMVKACASGGTGWPFFDFKPEVACKTGTAETGDGKTTHAWFTVFAPVENPEIVLTVLVEKGGEGSGVAAPIAKEILKKYFER